MRDKDFFIDVVVIGFILAMILAAIVITVEFTGIADAIIATAEANEAAVSVTVTIGAEVPCNEINCPEPVEEVPPPTMWERFMTFITSWW
jgi:hypothetical protein